MKIQALALAACGLLAATAAAQTSAYGTLQGIVHDPQHRPVRDAHIVLRAANSALTFTSNSNGDGTFELRAIPLGDYRATITDAGFNDLQQIVTVNAGSTVTLHLQLTIGSTSQSVEVRGEPTNVDSVTPETLITRADIAQTPGADRTNSLAMITDFVPGAYITHDMLHMRGGHELNWVIGGVSLPNTNIASNVAPQIDPKDIDTIETERGSYGADLGDRTYGIFNVVPRSGFERSGDGELVLTAGSFFQTNDQVSYGDHTARFAWYTSLNGNRTDYGLSPAAAQPVHDAANGYGGFGSMIYNRTPKDQFSLTGQLRTDFYQVPIDPDPNDFESAFYNSSQLRDGEHETDSYLLATWLHTFNPQTVSQLSPFFHFNRANLQSSPNDFPAITTAEQTGDYEGVQASLSTVVKRNTISGGVYGYAQHENDQLGAIFTDGSSPSFASSSIVLAGVEELYVEDKFKPATWLTLTAGERQTHFVGAITEDAFYPRVGAAVQLPKLHWVFRGFYGHFYQPPPVTAITGAGLQVVQSGGQDFVPLHGERNEEHQFGVQIPLRGWVLDADTFKNRGRNFLDHNNLGESSVFLPITVQGSLIQAWELTLRSPRLWKFGQAHLSYSNQLAQQIGPVTGGLVCVGAAAQPTDPCYVAPGYSALDHDQRNTLNVGFNATLPHRITGSFNVNYGSGFSNGDQQAPSPYTGPYLPSHTTADLSVGKQFSTNITASITALNVGNTRALLDNSLTFGGFHYNDPRQIYAALRYRFHF